MDALTKGLESLETLAALYAAWDELRLEQVSRRLERVDESSRLESEGRFLLGTVRAASDPEAKTSISEALLRPQNASLDRFLREGEARLTQARVELEARIESEDVTSVVSLERVQERIEERLQHYARVSPPSLVLWRRPVGKDRAVLHLERLAPDAALQVLYLATGKIALHHGFLLDDSTDASDRPPTPFYAEAGDPRPPPSRFPELARPEGRVSAVKGFLPLFIDRSEGALFYRFLHRGPVLEAELLEPSGAFRSILSSEEAELLAGQLLRWKLSGALQLRIEMG